MFNVGGIINNYISNIFGIAASMIVIYFIRGIEITRNSSSFRNILSCFNILHNKDSVLQKDDVKDVVDNYKNLYDGSRTSVGHISNKDSIDKRGKEYETMVSNFYDLVTDFYEWGWGQSFHFGPRYRDETHNESIKRAEYHLANMMSLRPDMKVLDIGCGIGGPLRNISEFCGADVTGVTINQYQVNVGNKYCAERGLDSKCRLIQGDFQKLPFEDETFNHGYAIESTCHSPDRRGVFGEMFRCLKPGGCFCGYEWVMTDIYNDKNKDHIRIKEGIEVGNGLPTLTTKHDVLNSLKEVGFELVCEYDANKNKNSSLEIPWYDGMDGKMTLQGFRMTPMGRRFTHAMVTTMETVGLAPKGSIKVSEMLNATADDLVVGGKMGIFTPSYFFLVRKPVKEIEID